MKKKISKILGVGLTLTLLVSLMVAVVPVGAAALLYSAVATPSKIGEVLQAGTDIDFLVAAPDGTTMFAYDNGALLYKSTNAGATWTTTNIGTGLETKTVVDLAVSPNYATDSTVVAAATDDTVYISVDGGTNFNAGPALTLVGGHISSLDVGKYYATGVVNVLVGLTGSTGNTTFRFPLSGAYAWTPVGALTGVNVVAVRFSPQHLVDAEILAVSTNGTHTILNTQFGTSAWNANIATSINGTVLLTGTATGAVIAFGSDYIGTGTNTILVGTRGSSADSVYRVSGLTMGATTGVVLKTALASDTDVQSVVVTGAIATASVLAGLAGDANVYRSLNITATAPTWTGSTTDPTGTNPTAVIWAGSAAYAGTTGADSALSKSADSGVNFSQIALIDVGSTGNITIADSAIVDANTMFVIMNNATGGYAPSSLFKTTDGGTSWQRVLAATPALTIVKASPNYATDSTLYLSDGTMTLKKSTDGGVTFTSVGVPAAVTALAVVDKDTYFAGAAAALYKSGRWATATGLTGTVKSIALSPAYATDKTLLVGNDGGDVYISTNDGVTFTAVGALDSLGSGKTVVVLPDPLFATNKTIYAAQSTDSSKGILRTTSTATTAVWALIDAGSSNQTAGLAVDTTSGALYAASLTANAGIRRSFDPLTAVVVSPASGPTFQSMAAATPFNLGAGAVLKSLRVLSGTSPVLYAITSGLTDPTTGGYGYTDRILTVTDTLTGVVTLTSPAANVVLKTETTASLAWKAVTGATGYDIWYGTTLTYTTATTTKTTSATTPKAITGLTGGTTYYWRVRANAPVQSQWSGDSIFITALGAPALPTVTLSPLPGTAGVSVTPTLTWPAVTGAKSYDIEITDDPFFVDILAYGAAITPNTVFFVEKPLKYSTMYYWRVRAVSSTSVGGWTVSNFITMAELVAEPEPTPPVIIQPTETITKVEVVEVPVQTIVPQPIPSYLLWIIIGIGAVLIIALITLIVRTRRVA